jgi:hypothetical protein
MSGAAPGLLIFGLPVRNRSCGACTLCCTLPPVDLPRGKKLAGERCEHVCSKGCRIYARRPDPCRVWQCRWLFDPATAGLRRPDHSGYIVDPMPDTILSNGQPVDVLQVWVDPKRRDAHRDPALRAYLLGVAETHRMPAIVRWSSTDGMVLAAPCFNEEGEWLELYSEMLTEEGLAAKLAEAGTRSLRQMLEGHG